MTLTSPASATIAARHRSRQRLFILAALAGALVPVVPAFAADATFQATIGGKPWSADFGQAVALAIGGKPALNVSATSRQSGQAETFNSMLMLQKAGAYVGTYAFGKENSGSFAKVDPADPMKGRSKITAGELVIDSYDAAAKTVAGHFSATATPREGGDPIAIERGSFKDLPVEPMPQ